MYRTLLHTCAIAYCLCILFVNAEQSWQDRNRGQGHAIARRRAVYSGPYGEESMTALDEWRSSLFKRTLQWYTMHGGQHYTASSSDYELFQPFLLCPPELPLDHFIQRGDAGKFMCGPSTFKAPCVIYSAGSKNNYMFEERMLKLTPCEVHTFDCTVVGRSIDPNRHFFYQQCLGRRPENAPSNQSFALLPEIMSNLKHTQIELLKIDIEGYEWDIFQDWTRQTPLPRQIALEAHYQMPWRKKLRSIESVAEMALYFLHMANLGYGITGIELNPTKDGYRAAELGLLLVEEPAHGHHQRHMKSTPSNGR